MESKEIKFDIVVGEICDALKNVGFKNRRKEDTLAVKHALIGVAKKFNISVWTQLNENEIIEDKTHLSNHEWLYDLIWYCYNDSEHYALTELLLAMESEWGGRRYSSNNDNSDPYGEVKYDFQKLLVCNAPIKLMIFKEHGKEETEKLLYFFQKRISESPLCSKEDTFLIVYYKMNRNSGFSCVTKSYQKNEQ